MKHYPILVNGYRSFLERNRKQPDWWHPPADTWLHAGLTVRINPELGLVMNRIRYLIKLYFKDRPITKSHIAGIGHLMRLGVGHYCEPGTVMSILDVRTGKLHRIPGMPNANFETLIKAEAETFVHLWDGIE